MEILNISNLTVSFSGKKAVGNICLSVRPGSVTAIVGESGSGKTITALSVLNLVPFPGRIESGSIIFKGRDILSMDKEQLREMRGDKISMLFQEPFTSLNPVLNIGEQLTETILAHRRCTKKEAFLRAEELLGSVRLESGLMRAFVHVLSGGMRQRVMLAMALSCDPDLLILDEPTTALDMTVQKEMMDLIIRTKERRNLSIIFITHDFSLVNWVSDYVAVMRKGEIVEQGLKKEIMEFPRHPYTKALMECIPRLGDKRKRLRVID